MKSKKIRSVLPLAILAAAGIAYAAHAGAGNLSAFGWEDIAVLCPIGALGTMLASKTVVPRAVVSLVLAFVGIVLLGRAFCAWVCPVPVWKKLRGLFRKGENAKEREQHARARAREKAANARTPLSDEELESLSRACKHHAACHAAPAQTRHFALGGALLSAAVFGFPVFCLVCPIGLSFAGVFVLITLFGQGDVTWSVVAIPVLLAVEVVFFRKWCSHICPISSLMSIVGKLNRTFRPSVDHDACLEDVHGIRCERCAKVCEVGINPRHPELGVAWNECTKCRECADVCPAHALTLPVLAKGTKTGSSADGQA